MTEWVRNVQAPDRHAFAIFLVAPGSTLDIEDEAMRYGGLVGIASAIFRFVRSLFRPSGTNWRLAVNEVRPDSHLSPTLHHEGGMDQATAEARSAALGELIASGAWDPATRRPPLT